MKEKKESTWKMRAAKTDRAQISELARRHGLKQAEAVRRAVSHALATMPKTAKRVR